MNVMNVSKNRLGMSALLMCLFSCAMQAALTPEQIRKKALKVIAAAKKHEMKEGISAYKNLHDRSPTRTSAPARPPAPVTVSGGRRKPITQDQSEDRNWAGGSREYSDRLSIVQNALRNILAKTDLSSHGIQVIAHCIKTKSANESEYNSFIRPFLFTFVTAEFLKTLSSDERRGLELYLPICRDNESRYLQQPEMVRNAYFLPGTVLANATKQLNSENCRDLIDYLENIDNSPPQALRSLNKFNQSITEAIISQLLKKDREELANLLTKKAQQQPTRRHPSFLGDEPGDESDESNVQPTLTHQGSPTGPYTPNLLNYPGDEELPSSSTSLSSSPGTQFFPAPSSDEPGFVPPAGKTFQDERLFETAAGPEQQDVVVPAETTTTTTATTVQPQQQIETTSGDVPKPPTRPKATVTAFNKLDSWAKDLAQWCVDSNFLGEHYTWLAKNIAKIYNTNVENLDEQFVNDKPMLYFLRDDRDVYVTNNISAIDYIKANFKTTSQINQFKEYLNLKAKELEAEKHKQE